MMASPWLPSAEVTLLLSAVVLMLFALYKAKVARADTGDSFKHAAAVLYLWATIEVLLAQFVFLTSGDTANSKAIAEIVLCASVNFLSGPVMALIVRQQWHPGWIVLAGVVLPIPSFLLAVFICLGLGLVWI